MVFTYFAVPSVTTTLSGASEWFTPIFNEFLPWALIGLGISIAVFVLGWIGGAFGHKK